MDRRDFLKSGILAAFLGPRDVSPPGGRKVALPQLRTTIGGNCDANGNLTIKSIQPSPHFYAVFTLIAQVSAGAPQWVLSAEGVPLGFAGGGKATIGAIYTNPGERMQLVVTGAAPNAVVTGSLFGFFATAPEDLPTLGTISSGGGLGALPGGQAVVQGSLTNVGDTVALPTGGASTVGLEMQSDTNAGHVTVAGTNIVCEGTADDANWGTVPAFFPAGAYWLGSLGQGVGVGNMFVAPAGGLSQFRLRLSAKGAGEGVMQFALRATPAGLPGQSFGQQGSVSSMPVVIANDQTAIPVTISRNSQLPTYWIAVGNSTKAIGAGATEQLLVIYHPATVAEQISIKKIVITIESNSVASILTIRVRHLNGATAPSGGTAVGVIAAAGDAALSASDVVQTYPTTKGTTDVGAAAAQSFSVGVSAAPTDVTKLQPITVYSNDDASNRKPLLIRSLTAEGWELEITSSAASTVVASAAAEVTVG